MRLALLCLSTLFWLAACAAPRPAPLAPAAPLSPPSPVAPAVAAPSLPPVLEGSVAAPPAAFTATAADTAPVKPSLPDRYQVGSGEKLWSIAARQEIYGDPLLWPLLYRANRDQIKDPRQIYPGQTLNIPRRLTPEELDEVRATALKSDAFPLEQLLKSVPAPTP